MEPQGTQTTQTTITTSKKYSLNWQDALKGAAVAALTILAATTGQILQEYANSLINHVPFVLDKVSIVLSLQAAFGAFIAYLIKNFLTPAQTVIKPGTPEIDTQ